jgi:Curlin associated repeat
MLRRRIPMTRKPIKRLAAGFAAAIVALSVVSTAAAGGSLSFHIAPQSADSRRVLRTGLQLYSVYNAIESGASIRQRGRNNSAGISQNSRGNFGVVHQEGRGHNGTLRQNGKRNAYGLFQFGRNTNANVVQKGDGSAGATFQFGW